MCKFLKYQQWDQVEQENGRGQEGTLFEQWVEEGEEVEWQLMEVHILQVWVVGLLQPQHSLVVLQRLLDCLVLTLRNFLEVPGIKNPFQLMVLPRKSSLSL